MQKPDFDDALLPDARKKIVENPLSLRNPITKAFSIYPCMMESAERKVMENGRDKILQSLVVAEKTTQKILKQVEDESVRRMEHFLPAL